MLLIYSVDAYELVKVSETQGLTLLEELTSMMNQLNPIKEILQKKEKCITSSPALKY
jgi:hypothetical protein